MDFERHLCCDEDIQSRIWLISDPQSSDPDEVERYLTTAISDLVPESESFDAIWHLGDSVVGVDIERNRAVARRQVDHLDRLGIPVRYVMGNHDLDHAKQTGEVSLPMYEAVRDHPDWRSTDSPEDFYFIEELGEYVVLFLSDHVALDGSWNATHGRIHGERDRYPYTASDYQAVAEGLAERDRHIIVAGHNAFPGGNRGAELQRRFFPLPRTVLGHVYGHAHIGDERVAGQNAYRTISYIDNHDIPQLNISSLEDRRGDAIRSAVLELYEGGGLGVFFRDHSAGTWLECYHVRCRPQQYVVRITDGVETVETFTNSTQNWQLGAVVDYLLTEYDLADRVSLPYRISGAGSGIVLAEEPHLPEGSEMRQPYETVGGYQLERYTDKVDKRKALTELAAECGLTLELDGLWR